MDSKDYFKKNKIKLIKDEKIAIKGIGLLTKLQLKYKIPQKEIYLIEEIIYKLTY